MRYNNLAFLIPGAFLLSLAALTILAPRLILAFLAAVLIFFGISVLTIGWKLFRLKSELDKTASKFAHYQFKSSGWKEPNTTTVHLENDTIEVVDVEVNDGDSHARKSRIVYH